MGTGAWKVAFEHSLIVIFKKNENNTNQVENRATIFERDKKDIVVAVTASVVSSCIPN